MTSVYSLKVQAKDAAKFHGHDMSPWASVQVAGRQCWDSECRRCGREMRVDPSPPPNGIDISGEAVAIGCTDSGELCQSCIVTFGYDVARPAEHWVKGVLGSVRALCHEHYYQFIERIT